MSMYRFLTTLAFLLIAFGSAILFSEGSLRAGADDPSSCVKIADVIPIAGRC